MATTLINQDAQVIAAMGLEAFLAKLTPLRAMSTEFGSEGGTEDDVVKVAVYQAAPTATNFDIASNNYEDAAADTVTFKSVTLDQRPKSTFSLNDVQVLKVDLDELTKNHAHSVAKQTLVFIMNQMLVANFSNSRTIAPASFDSDDFADLWGDAFGLDWGEKEWFTVINTASATSVLKDPNLKNIEKSASDSVLRDGEIGQVANQTIIASNFIPNNSENLSGFTTDGSGLAVAMDVIRPGPKSELVVDFAVATDPDSGISLGARMHHAPATGELFVTYEVLFGVSVGQGDGLIRITSA